MDLSTIIVIVIAILIILFIKLLQSQKTTKIEEYNYTKIDSLFTPAERSFLDILTQAVGNNAQIFGKVRVADVIKPKKGMSRSEWQKSFNKISNKHFDYLLCDKKNMSFLCAIELNDKSHNTKSRKNRDEFLECACKSAKIPLIQIPAKETYSIKKIQDHVSPYLPNKSFQSTANASAEFKRYV